MSSQADPSARDAPLGWGLIGCGGAGRGPATSLDKLYYKGAKRYPSQDKLNKAIETLKKAVASAPKADNAPMQKYFIAQCYEKLGKQAEARDYYGRVSKDHPGTPWATKAGKDLSRMASN